MSEFDLERFVAAQAPAYAQALAELEDGRKRSHWMWFVFPQLAALGRSGNARFYGIRSAAEAGAYLAQSVLGPRLRECTEAVLRHRRTSANTIFGSVDAMKFQSCMTLFEAVAETPEPFASALEIFYEDDRDETTLELLGSG